MRTSVIMRCVPFAVAFAATCGLAGCGDTQAGTTTTKAPAPTAAAPAAPETVPAETTLPEGRSVAAERPAPEITDTSDKLAQPARPATVAMVRTEPEMLDLGTVATGEKPTGTVRLVNTGEQTYKILSCKTNCGCTTANCPQGKELAPGESTEIDVSVTAGNRANKITKYVTFNIEDHAPIRLPVTANVVSYVTVTPTQLDKGRNEDGRLVIEATDGEPFRILKVDPPVIPTISDEAKERHELNVSWEAWDEVGSGFRNVTFELDHPKVKTTSLLVRGVVTSRQQARDKLLDSGVVDTPLDSAPAPIDQLAVAVRNGDPVLIEEALKLVPGQAERDTTLILASKRGYLTGMKALLDAGANANATGPKGRTALMSAVQSRKIEAVKLLLERGADINSRDELEGTALSWAAGPFGSAQAVAVLLASGAEVNVSDNNGMTPLIWAARFGDVERVEDLIEAGAKVTARDLKGKSALDHARERPTEEAKDIVAVLEPLLGGKAEGSASGDPAG